MKYISYIRISTIKQDISGLGTEAQRKAIDSFIKPDDILIAEYKEAESGKNDLRPELQKAIEHCKEVEATLLIQKLDRLSRNVAFIFMLRDSQVPFICIEFPEANSLTIGILAVLAQEERERISQRTKAALDVLKSKGVKLGKPENLSNYSRERSIEVRRKKSVLNLNNLRATALISSLRKENKSYFNIAKELNKYGFRTRMDKEFTAMSVKRLYDRYMINSNI